MKIKTITNKNSPTTFKGLYNNKLLLKGLKLAADNGTLFNASASLVLSSIARPIAIMSTPKTDKENKKLACAKALSSTAVGYLIMLLASLPVAKAVRKIDNNPSAFLKKSTIKNLQGNAKSLTTSKIYSFATQLFKLGIGFVIAAPKSALTCALIPAVMLLFKNPEKEPEANKAKKISGIISFKGIYNNATESLAKGIGKIIDTKPMQNFVKKHYETNYAQHITSLTDALLTFAFVHQTAKSKKIEQKRKKPLIYNSLISTGLCIAGGYALNGVTAKSTEKFIDKFKKINKDLPELEKYVEGIKIAKPALLIGGIYYILIPIISTFLADRTDTVHRPNLLK